MEKIYDLIIIDAGPAGLSASIYASRYKMSHLIFGAEIGGQINEIKEMENWPGEISISGQELIGKFTQHVKHYGVEILSESVSSLEKKEDIFEIQTAGKKYFAKTLILTIGASYRKMNIPGEREFTGRGVSYCATCDAMFFRDKTVCVVGGGNSAAVVALELADFAQKIYLISKEEKLLADPLWLEKISAQSKIELIRDTQVLEIKGEKKVEKIMLDKAYADKTFLAVEGVFIEVGTEPGASLARKLGVAQDEQNYIIVKEDMSTNVSGAYAAGDITTGSNKFRQVLTAASEGAIAAQSAYKNLKLK